MAKKTASKRAEIILGCIQNFQFVKISIEQFPARQIFIQLKFGTYKEKCNPR
jgi:hypothetical protein